jgi:hypothetical protein
MGKEKEDFKDRPRIRTTFGEILTTGVVIDVVGSSSGEGIELVRWDGRNYDIAPQFQDGSIIYKAGYLHPSLLAATRFPRGLADYGDATEFFWEIERLIRDQTGFSLEQSAFLTQFIFATWFPDCSASPVTLCITGMNMSQIMKLFRLLHVLTRRGVMAAALNPGLPFFMSPTLLLNIPRVSRSVGDFWRATNYRDTFIPGPKGTMRTVSCCKAIFCETEVARHSWAPEALHLALPPSCEDFAFLSEIEEAGLAAEYLPRLLMFRLRNLSLTQSAATPGRPLFAGVAHGGYLPACIAEDPEVRKALTLMIDVHEDDLLASRALDPHVAIIEAIWKPSHKDKEMSTDQVTVRVGAILHSRGETYRFNSKEIGWKLRSLGFSTHNNGKQKVLRFSRETRRRIHQLAAQFGLQLPKVADCEDCKGTQLTGKE